MTERWDEIQGKLDLVRVSGNSTYQSLSHRGSTVQNFNTVEPRFNEVPRDRRKFVHFVKGSLYRTPTFKKFSGQLSKCLLYRGKVNN